MCVFGIDGIPGDEKMPIASVIQRRWLVVQAAAIDRVWTDGEREEAVPRHREINEQLARAILRRIQKEKT